MSGRYASYWNAFLFDKIFAENCMKMKGIGPRSADVVCFEQEDTTVNPKSVSLQVCHCVVPVWFCFYFSSCFCLPLYKVFNFVGLTTI